MSECKDLSQWGLLLKVIGFDLAVGVLHWLLGAPVNPMGVLSGLLILLAMHFDALIRKGRQEPSNG